MEQPILDGLLSHNGKGSYPWHMPGHKRRMNTIFPEIVENPFLIDVTEVGDLDELHHPQGMIQESMNQMGEIYGSDQSYFLVNGSTCGILAAISAVCKQGDTIIVARNCHKSVYNAIRLLRLKPIYLMPEWNEELQMFGGVLPEQVKRVAKEHPNAKGVILVSPTYEGVVSDIEKIARIVHKMKMPLIVDEAHGAHFEYASMVNETISAIDYSKVPRPAIRLGADIVIESLHKTLPAMTQCAILHYKKYFVQRERLEEYLSIYQSSSPSYVFLASMEACIQKMDHERDGLFLVYKHLIVEYRKKFAQLKHIHLVDMDDFKSFGAANYDSGKLVFSVKNKGIMQGEEVLPFSGVDLRNILEEEYGQTMEMAAQSYVIAMTSVADTKEAFESLYQALEVIDSGLTDLNVSAAEISPEKKKMPTEETALYSTILERKMLPAEAMESNYSEVSLMEAAGRISRDYIYIYPPGIPVVVPGEVISRKIVKAIRRALEQNLRVHGVKISGEKEKIDYDKKAYVTVVRENRWLSRIQRR